MKIRFSLPLLLLALGAILGLHVHAQTFPTPSSVSITKNNTTGNLTGNFATGPNTITVNSGGNITVTGNGVVTATTLTGNISGNPTISGNLTISGGQVTIPVSDGQPTINLISSGGSGKHYQIFADTSGNVGIYDATSSRFPLLFNSSGNLTVSSGDSVFSPSAGTNSVVRISGSGASDIAQLDIKTGNGTTSGRTSRAIFRSDETSPQRWDAGMLGTTDFAIQNNTAATTPLSISASTGTTAVTGNATVTDAAANNRVALFVRAQNNTNYSATVLAVQGDRTTTNSTYNLFAAENANQSGQFVVRDSGNVINTNNSYGAISDRKLKENIQDVSPALASMMQVRVRSYNLKAKPGETQIGVIAQELEEVFPALVEQIPDRDANGELSGDTTRTVKYSQLVPLLVKSLQELKAEFDAYKAAHP